LVSVFHARLHFNLKQGSFAHIFNEHLLRPSNHDGIVMLQSSEPIWISVYLLTGVVILTTVKKYSLQHLIRNIQFGFTFDTHRKFERKDLGRGDLYSQLLNLFFILNLSFLAYMVNTTFGIFLQSKDFLFQTFFFAGVIFLLISWKTFLNGLLTWVSSKGKFIQEYRAVSGNLNRVTGVFLFPILMLFGFSEANPYLTVVLSLALLCIMILIKWIKGLLLCVGEEGLGILQILTYFCALEILPQLVLVKYTIETFKAG
jgi:hypothetical protein